METLEKKLRVSNGVSKKEIDLTPFLEAVIMEHQAAIQERKKQLNRDLKMIFDSKGVDMPNNFNFEVKEGKLIYEPK